jgi:membrane protease YdiL (CAAX protease family)
MTKSTVATPVPQLLQPYWTESSRPLMSLIFIAPMLVVYEVGVVLLGQPAVRSGADVWLRKLLSIAGIDQYFLLPLLTFCILLAWHHVKGDRWHVRWMVLYGMWIESIVLGAALLLLGYCQHAIVDPNSSKYFLATGNEGPGSAWLAYLGAGIYEELLFRLILLPAIIALLCWCGLMRGTSLVAALIVGSFFFACAHYRFDLTIGSVQILNVIGDPFDIITFSFRWMAGIFFAILFLYRGFGIAAGAHALYDIFLAGW